MDEPTAWEEINPPMVSARPQGPALPCSAHLQPATTDDFRNELTACLTLVAPVGMTEEAKRDWLAVAWGTLQHLPADLLRMGCKVARETCDHPARVVPAIVEATRESVAFRSRSTPIVSDAPRLARPDYVKPEEAAAILREYGFKRGGAEL